MRITVFVSCALLISGFTGCKTTEGTSSRRQDQSTALVATQHEPVVSVETKPVPQTVTDQDPLADISISRRKYLLSEMEQAEVKASEWESKAKNAYWQSIGWNRNLMDRSKLDQISKEAELIKQRGVERVRLKHGLTKQQIKALYDYHVDSLFKPQQSTGGKKTISIKYYTTNEMALKRVKSNLKSNQLGIGKNTTLKVMDNPKGQGKIVYSPKTQFGSTNTKRLIVWLVVGSKVFPCNGATKNITPDLPWYRDADIELQKAAGWDKYDNGMIKIVFGQ